MCSLCKVFLQATRDECGYRKSFSIKFDTIMMNLLICILITLHQTQTHARNVMNSLYNELRLLGGSCDPVDTCLSLLNPDDDNLWNNRHCECGQHCILSNTCCMDSPYAGMYFIHPPAKVTCKKVVTNDIFALMVSECSTVKPTAYLHDRCTNSDEDLKDPLSVLPVTSMLTKVTYKNYFCAMCNDDVENIVFWNIKFQGTFRRKEEIINDSSSVLNDLVYNESKNAWTVLNSNTTTKQISFQKVKLKFTLPSNLRKVVKRCYPDLVADCLPQERNSILHLKCLAYYAPVKLREETSGNLVKFRNIHCGLCNNITAVNTEDACELDPRRSKPAMSFALLLDVNRKDGDLVGKIQFCKEGQVFDPFFKKCRSMKCVIPNYVLKDGSCVKSSNS